MVCRKSTAAKSHLPLPLIRAHDSFLTASLGPLAGFQGRSMARSRRNLAVAVLFFCPAASALAASPAPDTTTNTHLRVRTIAGYLMVVGVSINDRGPFDFL